MVHAFNLVTLFDKFPYHIESLDSCVSLNGGNQLLVGTAEGILLRFNIMGDTRGMFSAAQVDANRIGTKKSPIVQLNAVEEFNTLIILYDGYISLYDLSTVRLRCQLSKTKDCNLYAFEKTARGITLCAAVRKKIIVYEIDATGVSEKREIPITDVVRTMVVYNNNICVGFRKDYSMANLQTGVFSETFPGGKNGPPLAITLPTNELVLELDNLSIFIGYDGKPTKSFGLTWDETPTALSYSFPYVISVLSRIVQVKSIYGSQKISQTLPLKGVKLITHKNDIYVASSQTCWRLVAVPLSSQVAQLENDRKYKQALSLAENIPFSSEEEKKEKLKNIKIARAYNLFAKRKFKKSLELFFELNYDPLRVIGLYPDLLPRNLRATFTYPITIPELEGQILEAALQEMINYLAQKRTNCPSDPKLRSDDYATTRDLAEIIDTALLKAYLKTKEQLVAPLLRLPNNCNIKECEQVLQQNKKFIELVLLYKSKGKHLPALDLLKKLGQGPKGSSPLNGPTETVRYLKSLGKDHIELILNFSKWVLTEYPDEALTIFTEERSPEDQLPPARVLDHITKEAPKLIAPYLEYLIKERGEKNPDFHNELANIYFRNVLILKKETPPTQKIVPAGMEPGQLGKYRRTLLEFLETSKYYSPEKMFKMFPQDDLYEERAILLSRIGDHENALNIYAHKIGNFAMAEEYCEKHYSKNLDSKDVYLSLLRVYLRPPEGRPAMMEPALKLLNKYYTKIDASKALELVPSTTPLKQLLPFLEAVIRDNTKNSRNNQVVKNLLKTESLQVKFQHMKARSRVIKIQEGRKCPVCDKKLGTSVFACYPNGVVVHFICFKDKNVCPVTGTRFNKEDVKVVHGTETF